MRRVGLSALVVLLAAAAPAPAGLQKAFPRLLIGLGSEPTSGGGVIAGSRYITRTAVIAWNLKWNTLTLYLLPRANVTCGTLRRVTTSPGQLIQVYVTGAPHATTGPVAKPQVAFMTVHRDPKVPPHVAGLKNGAQLTFTRINSYPGGVWHGLFKVPRRVYGDGKLYGYNGTFAAKWCELRR
jgi:hypothetical protein